MGLATGYRGNPRVSTARATAFHCAMRFHGKCHGCGHGTCRASVRGNLRGSRHVNPRKDHGNCHGIFHGPLHVNCRGKTTAIKGECREIPRQLPRQSSHSKCHGNKRQLPRHSKATATAIATPIFTGGNLRRFPRQTTAFRGDCHGNFRSNCHGNSHGKQPQIAAAISTANHGIPRLSAEIATAIFRTPRQSAVIATAISTAINGNCHFNRRQISTAIHGNPPQTQIHGSCNGNPR